MNLEQLIRNKKITKKIFTKIFDISFPAMHLYKTRKSSPGLLNAIKFMYYSEGRIKPEDLLSIDEYELFQNFKATLELIKLDYTDLDGRTKEVKQIKKELRAKGEHIPIVTRMTKQNFKKHRDIGILDYQTTQRDRSKDVKIDPVLEPLTIENEEMANKRQTEDQQLPKVENFKNASNALSEVMNQLKRLFQSDNDAI